MQVMARENQAGSQNQKAWSWFLYLAMHPKLWSWTGPHRREQLGRCVAHGRLLPAEVPRS